jgi:hypothetical protein
MKAHARCAVKAERLPPRLARRTTSQPGRKRCAATTRSGKPCPNWPLPGKKRCNLHTGDTAKVLGARGGRRRAIFNPEGLEPFPPPKDVSDLLRLVMQTVVEVRAAKLDTKTATAIFYGCGVGRSILETADLDARLKALEERHGSLESARARVQ